MKNWNMKLRTKLILLFVLIGTVPMLASNVGTYFASKAEIVSLAEIRSNLLTQGKANDLVRYFSELSLATQDLAGLPMTRDALVGFSAIFENAKLDKASSIYSESLPGVTRYYKEQFGAEYLKQQNVSVDADSILAKLDPISVVAQGEFIVQNENPLGQKNKLIKSLKDSPYSKIHEKYHAAFNRFLDNHALYDIFLVNNDGRVVYTVFKELDFATSLQNGPWKDSGLAAAVRGAKGLPSGKVYFEDYKSYTPSYDAAAGFLAAPIYDEGGTQLGTLVAQVPTNKIVDMFKDRNGLGDTGDFILVSKSDRGLRVDTTRMADKLNLKNQFAPGSKLKIESPIIEAALAQTEDSKTYVGKSYDGLHVFATARKVNLAGVEWVVFAEMGSDEILSGLNKMLRNMILTLLASGLAIGFIAYWFGNGLSKELMTISNVLSSSSRNVSQSSSQSAASSTELSEAATEQAASLQETMASIEEISAMVNQNAESATRAKSAVEGNLVSSNEGTRSVDEMLSSIAEIKSTNDEILSQMESSNKEFSEIVKIISEIGEKTTVINDIVFQTKLLSFNASVEAARAGEHGKGFAVVAEEVGNLAQMSGNAAREITEMLTGSIKRVNSIVDQTRERVDRLVEVGQDKIAMGQSTAQRCKSALDKITDNAKSLSSMVSEIAHASKEQAQGIQEINKAISQLDQVTQQNSAVAQQSSTQAEELSAQAAELHKAVESLVGLIEGSNVEGSPQAVVSSRSTAKKSAVSAKVSEMKRVASKPKENVRKAGMDSHKKVAGSDVVPSSDDPGFEEF